MADITFENNSFQGNVEPGYFMPLLLPKGGLYERGLVTLKTGIKKKKKLRDFDVDIEFQNPSAKFNDDGLGIKISESSIDPVAYEVMKEIDYSDLLESYESDNIPAGSMEDYSPDKTVEQHLLDRMAAKIGIANEELYILGKGGVTAAALTFDDDYPGLLPSLQGNAKTIKRNLDAMASAFKEIAGIDSATDTVTTVEDHGFHDGDVVSLKGLNGDQQNNGVSLNGQSFSIVVTGPKTFRLEPYDGEGVVDVTGAGAATTGKAICIHEDNVVGILSTAFRSIPRKIRRQKDFKLPVADHIADSYKMALAKKAEGGSGLFTVGDRELDFLTLKIESMPYWQPNLIGAWSASNIFLGLDLATDEEFIKAVALHDNTNDMVVRYRARMKSDIKPKFFDEVFLMGW